MLLALSQRPRRFCAALDAALHEPAVLGIVRLSDPDAPKQMVDIFIGCELQDWKRLAELVAASQDARCLMQAASYARSRDAVDPFLDGLALATAQEPAFLAPFDEAFQTVETLTELASHALGRVMTETCADDVDGTGMRIVIVPHVRLVT